MTDEVSYNIATIRKLLAAVFDDVSLDAFCNDHFFGVYDRFGRGMRKDEKITVLCVRPGQLFL